MAFENVAVQEDSLLRVGAHGPSGGGKSYTLLSFARFVADQMGKEVAVIDTENKSMTKYASQFRFHPENLMAPYTVDRYVKLIEDAGDAADRFGALVIDSTSHVWAGSGGLLEYKEELANSPRYDNYSAWSKITPMHNRFIEAIIASPLHVFVSMRSKQAYEKGTNAQGKTVINKLGLNPVQRDGFEYEMDIVIQMLDSGHMVVDKTRFPGIAGLEVKQPGEEFFQQVWDWAIKGDGTVNKYQYANGESAPNTAATRRIFNDFQSAHGRIPNDGQELADFHKLQKEAQPA